VIWITLGKSGFPAPSGSRRRDLQRRLTSLGFGTKVSGKFDDTPRAERQ
jgi:hypothetical protein